MSGIEKEECLLHHTMVTLDTALPNVKMYSVYIINKHSSKIIYKQN